MKEYLPEGALRSQSKQKNSFSFAFLEVAQEKKQILEASVVLCDSEMNLHVALGEITGIIPKEEVSYSFTGETPKDIAILTRVGKKVCFHVKKLYMGASTPIAILSRRSAQKECYENYINHLRPGDVISAKVTHLEKFGAFLDIGCGIISLLPIDFMSVSRISHPKLRMTVGEECRVIIKSKDDKGRIYVTRKELFGTWEQNASLFSAGQTVAGIIRSIEPYGIFVELTPNLTGLAELKEGVKENTIAAVYIKSILPEKMKIKLVIIDTYGEDVAMKTAIFTEAEEARHIDRWQFSPTIAEKKVETVFL